MFYNIGAREEPSLTLEKLKNEGFDSVYAPRDTLASGGVLHDEFVIYDPDQALPRYIIHYTKSYLLHLEESSSDDEADDVLQGNYQICFQQRFINFFIFSTVSVVGIVTPSINRMFPWL
jgi:hypothetical protein